MTYWAFYSLRYGMDCSSLLKVVMGPVEVKIRLSFAVWLSHGNHATLPIVILSETTEPIATRL